MDKCTNHTWILLRIYTLLAALQRCVYFHVEGGGPAAAELHLRAVQPGGRPEVGDQQGAGAGAALYL